MALALMHLLAEVLRFFAEIVDPIKSPKPETRSSLCGTASALDSELAQEMRNDDAMSMLDDDTLGYMLFRVRVVTGEHARVSTHAQLHPDSWEAVCATMAHTIVAGETAMSR